MKRIALAVAVGSLLATPVVFAQSDPQPSLSLGVVTPKDSSKGIELYVPPPEATEALPKGSFEDARLPRTSSAVRGSFEDPTVGNRHAGTGTPVTGSFEDPTSTF